MIHATTFGFKYEQHLGMSWAFFTDIRFFPPWILFDTQEAGPGTHVFQFGPREDGVVVWFLSNLKGHTAAVATPRGS